MTSDKKSVHDLRDRFEGAGKNGDRNKTIRLADVQRGNKTWRQFQLLANHHGNGAPTQLPSVVPPSQTRYGKTFSLSANTEKRKAMSPYHHQNVLGLQGRHSCPTLPGISSASLARLSETSGNTTEAESRQEKCVGWVPTTGVVGKTTTNIEAPSFSPNENDGKRKNRDEGIRTLPCPQGNDIDSNSRFMRSECTANNSERSTVKENTEMTDFPPRTSKSMPIPIITIDSHSDDEVSSWGRLTGNEFGRKQTADGIDGKTGKMKSRREYSVLLNGGTLKKKAPYLDDIGASRVEMQNSASKFGRSGASLDKEGTSESPPKPSTSASRKLDPPWTSSDSRQMKSYSDLFDHQQELLLPRYKKLASITGDYHRQHVQQRNHGSGDGAGENLQDQLCPVTDQHSVAREVFEKVRLLIHGPHKAHDDEKKLSNDTRVRQPMPIYLKSGLPCGFVDPSSKCDAWLDANDFDDK